MSDRLITALAAVTLLMAACGDDDGEVSESGDCSGTYQGLTITFENGEVDVVEGDLERGGGTLDVEEGVVVDVLLLGGEGATVVVARGDAAPSSGAWESETFTTVCGDVVANAFSGDADVTVGGQSLPLTQLGPGETATRGVIGS